MYLNFSFVVEKKEKKRRRYYMEREHLIHQKGLITNKFLESGHAYKIFAFGVILYDFLKKLAPIL